MNQDNDFTDREWPPGTVRLATLLGGNNDNADIILQPRPTSSPNDPLVCPPDISHHAPMLTREWCRTGRNGAKH